MGVCRYQKFVGVLLAVILLAFTTLAYPTGEIGEIEAALETADAVDIIVWLNDNEFTSPTYQEDLDKKRSEIRNVQDEVLSVLDDNDLRLKFRYMITNGFAGSVSRSGFEKLRVHPLVDQMFTDKPAYLFLAESRPLIRAHDVFDLGFGGSGVTVCVIDTGVNYTHPNLGRCFGPGCKVVMGYDFCNGPSCTGAPDPDPMDEHGHGTHVAGIVASDHYTLRGIAPNANLAAIKVFNAAGFTNESAIAAGIDFCTNYASQFNVKVITMSLGDRGAYTSANCPTDYNTAILNAVYAGIFVDAASGNDAHTNGISYPACAPGVTSVGATYDANVGEANWSVCSDQTTEADQVVCFTNRGANLDLLAPGSIITSTALRDEFVNKSGTSMAAPHVAGVAASLYQVNPSLLPYQVERLLKATGKPIYDQSTSLTFPRVDARRAVSVGANPANWVYEKRITFDPAVSSGPSAATDFNGNVHIVWQDSRNGNWEIYYKKLNNLGINLTSDIRLTFNPSQSEAPGIAVDRNNFIHVIWADSAYENRPQLFYKKLNNNGISLTPDLRITSTTGSSSSPSFAIDALNNIHIVWQEYGFYRYEIRYKKLNNNGINLTADVLLISSNSDQYRTPSLAIGRNNNVHVAWNNYDRRIEYQRLDSVGNNLSTIITLAMAGTSERVDSPSLAVDDNFIHLGFASRYYPSSSSVYYDRYNSSGSLMQRFSDPALYGGIGVIKVTADARGDTHLSWSKSQPPTTTNWEVYYKKFNSSGSELTPNTRLTFDLSLSNTEFVTIDQIGNAHIFWVDQRDNNQELYYKRSFEPISIRGVPRIGSTVTMPLSDPEYPNLPYFLVASLGNSPGIPLRDGRIIPLNPDGVFLLSLLFPSLMGLQNSQSAFSNIGAATVTWSIPNFSELIGLTIYLGFITIDQQTGEIVTISQAVPVTLVQ